MAKVKLKKTVNADLEDGSFEITSAKIQDVNDNLF